MTTAVLDARVVMEDWPKESREAAQLVIDRYGDPDEVTPTQLRWTSNAGEWKRVIAQREFLSHDFPAPHIDCVESVLDYRVPPHRVSDLAAFDGSVVVERTAGEISARCHDIEANRLALNLAHDIVAENRPVEDARAYYGEEFLNARRGKPTPYMNELRFGSGGDTRDPGTRTLSDADLEAAQREGKQPER